MTFGEIEHDIACVVLRIEQINREQEPEHWLWDRVMDCDIPRLKKHINEEMLESMARLLE